MTVEVIDLAKRKCQKLRDDALDRIGNDQLREALLDKLTVAEINELTRQTERAIRKVSEEAAEKAVEETYKRLIAVMLRVLHDRFGFDGEHMERLYDETKDYLADIGEGLLSTQEMLDCLKNEDGIHVTWDL